MFKFGTKEYFEDIYQSADIDAPQLGVNLYRFNVYADILRKNINKSSFFSILDVGCGTGDFTYRLKEFGDEIQAIDISEIAIEQAKRKHKDIEFRVGAFPFSTFRNAYFDLVCCLEVIYYLDEPQRRLMIDEIYKILKPGGKVLFAAVTWKNPYFPRPEFEALVSSKFKTISTSTIHLKFFSLLEVKMYNLLQRIWRRKRGVAAKSFFKGFFNSKAVLHLFNNFSKMFLKDKSISHVVILAEKIPLF